MKVVIDPAAVAAFQEFGRRTTQQRYYYAADDWPAVLLRTERTPLNRLVGKTCIALFDYETTDSNIVLDQFPAAPGRWREMQIVQVSLKPLSGWRGIADEMAVPLSEALKRLKD